MENDYAIRAKVIQEIFPESIYNSSNKEIYIFCPNGCHETKRKLQINIEKNTGHCWVCGGISGGIRGNIFYFLSKFATYQQKQEYLSTLNFDEDCEWDAVENLDIKLPESFRLCHKRDSNEIGQAAYSLLKKCKIKDSHLIQNKVGYATDGDFKNMIIFPSFNHVGKLNYFVGRTIFGESYFKYKDCVLKKKNIVFNEIFINWKKPIILVEGVKGLLKHFDIPNIIPLLGTPKLNEKYLILEKIILNSVPRVYVCFDPDAESKAIENVLILKEYGINSLLVTTDRQIDEIPTTDFIYALKRAREPEVDLVQLQLMR